MLRFNNPHKRTLLSLVVRFKTTLILLILFYKGANSQQYSFKNYGLTDGLGQSQVQTITEDNLGYLWVGTRGGGISRFDGHTFKNITQEDGLVGDFILSLFFDNKELMIGTSTGLCKIAADSIYSNLTKTFLDSLIIQDIQLPYIATSNGLFKIDENGGVYKVDLGTNYCSAGIYQFTQTENGIYGATDKGIIKLSGDEKTCIRNINRIRNNFFKTIITDSKGNIWCGSLGGGITKLTPSGEKNNYSKSDGMLSIDVNTIFEDSKGIIWIGSNGQGVTKYDGKNFTHITQNNGLANDFVHSIYEDKQGNIWFGTSNGLSKLTSEKYILYEKSTFLTEGGAYIYHKDHDENSWIATFNGGIKLNEKPFKPSGLTNRRVKVITSSPIDSSVWIGSDGGGVYKYQNNTLSKLPIGNVWCRDIQFLDSSKILIGTLGNGLFICTEDSIQNKMIDENPKANRINKIILDSTNVYLATDDGVYLHNKEISKLNIPNERYVTASTIGSTHFYGGMGIGITQYNVETKEAIQLKTAEGLTSNNVYTVFSDSNKLFVGSEKGLDEFQWTGKKLKKVRTHHQKDGFLGIETLRNGMSFDGRYYWISTVNGLVRYDPSLEKRKNYDDPSHLRFESIELYYNILQKSNWFDDSLSLNNELFSSNENHFTFRFIATNLSQKSPIKYKWRLVGYDNIWTTPSYQSFATYPNLPPGSYRFEAQSLSNEQWSAVIHQTLQIDAPFWQKTWFYVLLVVGLVLIALMSIFLIIKRIKKKNNLEKERLIAERKMIELEQQAVRLQMNPHFLFNSLNAIKGAVAQQQTKEAKKAIDQFAKLMRAMLDNTKEGFVTIKKEVELIDLYLQLEQLNHSFTYDVVIDESISLSAKIPGMMVQPLVENAVLHGVSSVENGSIKLHLHLMNNYVSCEVFDNGIGIQKSKEKKLDSVHSYESKATQIIQSRLTLLAKEYPKVSFEIDSNENGTTIRLILPYLL